MAALDSIIGMISQHIVSVSPEENMVVYGLARLMIKSNQLHPVATLNNAHIHVNDKKDSLLYHRVISNTTQSQKEEFMYGPYIPRETSVKIRTVLIYKKVLGVDYVYDVVNRIPLTLNLEGLKYIDIGEEITIIEDDESVWRDEFSDTDYEKRREPYHVRAIEYSINYILCAGYVIRHPNFNFLSDGSIQFIATELGDAIILE